MVHSLLNEEVLIREGDLIGNRELTGYLRDDFTREIFSEFLSVGAIKILRLSSNSFPSNISRNPRRFPMSARAEDQERNRSDAGKRWKATTNEWELFSYLDRVLIGSTESYRLQHPFPEKNMFAAELSELLVNRQEYKLDKRDGFKGITPEMADRFIEFCNEPDSWNRFLSNQGIKILDSRRDGFYRTQAYQCASLYGHEARKAMQRLIESTYAACECDREKADGRYGRSALAELPARCDSYDETDEVVTRFDAVPVVPKNSGLKLAIAHGIGDVVAEVRSKHAFKQMQKCINTIGADAGLNQEYIDPQRAFSDAWSAVCSDYEEAWARHIIRQQALDSSVARLLLAIYVGARTLGFVTFGIPYELYGYNFNADMMHPFDAYYIIPRIETLSPRFLQRLRGLVRMPSARAEMFKAASLRCSRVELNAKQT